MLSTDGALAEAQPIKTELLVLKQSVATLKQQMQSQDSALQRQSTVWQQYQQSVDELKPWIENAELQVNMGSAKPVNLHEAQEQLKIMRVSLCGKIKISQF